jgi:hypothetical protein
MQSSPTPEKALKQQDASNKLFYRIEQALENTGLSLVASETNAGDVIYVVRGKYYQNLMDRLTVDDQKGFMDIEVRIWTQEDGWKKE